MNARHYLAAAVVAMGSLALGLHAQQNDTPQAPTNTAAATGPCPETCSWACIDTTHCPHHCKNNSECERQRIAAGPCRRAPEEKTIEIPRKGTSEPDPCPECDPRESKGSADPETEPSDPKPETTWAPAVEPKPLGDAAKRGLQWLVDHQHEDGGWGQGEESRQMGRNVQMAQKSNVADTCVAALALLRSGSTPASGVYAAALRAGIDYVCGQIEGYDQDDLFITDIRGTRVQSKIGPYVDTFMAALLLTEVQGNMGSEQATERVRRNLKSVLAKMTKHQKQDGTWDGRGWAPVLSQGVAVKAINRAKQAGLFEGADADEALARAEKKASAELAAPTSAPKSGSAGVGLYGDSANVGAVTDSQVTKDKREAEINEELAKSLPPEQAQRLRDELTDISTSRRNQQQAVDGLLKRLDDPAFLKGFGSNGGEEFLSYMTISESLVVKGGEDWETWDRNISNNLARIQNGDGSWSGHHCITGRNFCTAAALLVLMADRAPFPVTSSVQGR